jgi:GxxExxY protein
MTELLYKELCYKITGIAFEIHNTLGSGLKEKIYADAFEEIRKDEKINYKREVYSPIKIRGKIVVKNYFDFTIEDKLVVELKSGSDKYKEVCNQLFQYLKSSNLKLGLIIRFTKDGVKTKRIPNLY